MFNVFTDCWAISWKNPQVRKPTLKNDYLVAENTKFSERITEKSGDKKIRSEFNLKDQLTIYKIVNDEPSLTKTKKKQLLIHLKNCNGCVPVKDKEKVYTSEYVSAVSKLCG